MLAPNIKTASELRITEDEKQALLDLLPKLEAGKLKRYCMTEWCVCLAHHSGIVSDPPFSRMMAMGSGLEFSPRLMLLFAPPDITGKEARSQTIAAQAIRQFLAGSSKPWEDARIARHRM